MYEKLVSRLRAAGIEAEESQAVAGYYFDGVDHAEHFPVVRAESDFYMPFSLLDGICKRLGLVYDWRSCWGTGTRIITIWKAEDREKARRLDEKAQVFLDAFWRYRHDNGPEDVTGMIAAGKKAVSMWEWLNQ